MGSDAAYDAPSAPPIGQTVVKLTLSSPVDQPSAPWTFGQVFRRGDVPAGRYLTTNANLSQVLVRNRWPDGSVKFVVMSGLSPMSPGAPTVIEVGTSATSPSSATVPEPTALDAQVTFTGAVTGTYSLKTALGTDLSTWDRTKAGRVRQILGPMMSEFHYYLPTSDAHVTVWFYVRAYAGGSTEIETVVENGWMGVPVPGERDYAVSCSVAGKTTYAGSVAHFSHTRWSRVDWVGSDPSITPRHDVSYLRASKMIPNYGYLNPGPKAFSDLASDMNPAPFALGNWSEHMGDAGYQPAIGILPQWESLYATTADGRAYAATISNNRGAGRWPLYYRDENTGRVPLYTSYPNTTLSSGWGTPPPAATGGSRAWDIPHHPSNGYLAYLLEGRWTQLESLEFAAMTAILETNPVTRRGGGVLACLNAPLTTRGAAWTWRTMGEAAAITPAALEGAAPADLAVGASFVASIHDTAAWNKGRYIDGTIDSGAYKNTLGWIGQYDRYTGGGIPADQWWGGSWMVAFQGMALGHIADLGIEGLTNQGDLEAVRDFVYDDTLLTIGDESTWNFRRAGTYSRPYLNNGSGPSAPSFMTVAQAFAAYKTSNGLAALTANSGDTLKQHDSESDVTCCDTSNVSSGYWALHVSVLAQAVDANRPGAKSAYDRVTSATNFDASQGSNTPQFAFVPRQ